MGHMKNSKRYLNLYFYRTYFKARDFRGMKFSCQFNFAGFLGQFLNFVHFNFLFQPKYYILWHFNFTLWPKYHNSQHFNFAVVLKIKFLCMWHFSSSGIKSFFGHPYFRKVLRTSEKCLSGLKISSSSSFESTSGFTNLKTWELFSFENGHI